MADNQKNLCAMIPAELHSRVRAEQEQAGVTLSAYITELLTKYYEGGMEKMKEGMRTMAFQMPEETFQRLKRYLERESARTGKKVSQKEFVLGLIQQVAGGHGLALQTRGETEAEMEEEIVRARELVWQAACAWLELVWCGDGAEELLSQLGCVRVTAQISASGDLDRAGQAAALMRAVSRYREDVSLSLGGDGSGLGGLGALLEDLDAGGYRLSAWRLTA